MENLFRTSYRLVEQVDCSYKRYLYDQIEWTDRMIGIKGARGVGKTTMLLQYLHENFPDRSKALYVSLDNIWFAQHSLSELAEYHYTHGGTHLLLDEVHRYTLHPWSQELKNLYDSYPDLHIIFTGSSLLEIDNAIADLSRRCLLYELRGLSFREYLNLEGFAMPETFSLDEILAHHQQLATQIAARLKVLPYFERYQRQGFYPFYREMSGEAYLSRIRQIVNTVLENDVPAVEPMEYSTITKAKQLLVILAERVPFTLNISTLCNTLATTRNQTLRLLLLLQRASVVRQLFTSGSVNMKALTKPEKILFDNPNLMYALGNRAESGTVRESFFANQLSVGHRLVAPTAGDLRVDDRHTFEVGGAGKDFSQISGVADSYVVADGIEIGVGHKIPLWLFGMMY